MATHLFIGGSGRSGTNITRKIFANNQNVASIPFEYRFIIDPDGLIDFYQSMLCCWSPYMADVKIKRLKHFLENLGARSTKKTKYIDWELGQWLPNYQKNIDTLIRELKSFEYSGFWPGASVASSTYNIYFAEYRSDEVLAGILGSFIKNNLDEFMTLNDKKFFVEDNTWNILFAKELNALMPDSKLLHMVRDPRDVICSFMKQRWCPNDFSQALAMYKSIMTKWFRIEESLPENYYKIIKLEDLIENPLKNIGDACSFSGIPFDENMLNITLDKSSSGRWKKELKSDNIRAIELELEEVFYRLNYEF